MGETGRDLLNLSDKERVAAAPFAYERGENRALSLSSKHWETSLIRVDFLVLGFSAGLI